MPAFVSDEALREHDGHSEPHGSFEDQALWRGIADHARHRRAILAAHRTGRGEWSR